MRLVTAVGPWEANLDLRPPGPLRIGRRAGHELVLADPVSRDHARIEFKRADDDRWFIIDTASKHGTRLNDVALVPGQPYPIQPGDVIQIAPWTFRVEAKGTAVAADDSTIRTRDDSQDAGSTIATVTAPARPSQSHRYLTLMLQCAKAIHRAEDPKSLADAVVDAAVFGTGFTNAAFLRPIQRDGSVQVVSHRGAVLGGSQGPQLSRSLIHRAAAGEPVTLQRQQSTLSTAVSIVELGIDEALCVPIMLGATPAGFLYLDARREDVGTLRLAPEAIDFAVGIGQIAAMALANLMRVDLQKRLVGIEAEMIAAAEAQRWVLPTRDGRHGPLEYAGENRAGRQLSGDFFDFIPIDNNRLAITIGDVSGKGIAASVLMTAVQGFLHAALRQHGDPARAVDDLNAYVVPRCGEGRFLTLWVAVIDPRQRVIRFVDAGHGYVVAIRRDQQQERLAKGRDIPVGVLDEHKYAADETAFGSGDRLLGVSDGLVEQAAPATIAGGRDQFGLRGVLDALHPASTVREEIEAIFAAVDAHAGGAALDDDATAIMVRLSEST